MKSVTIGKIQEELHLAIQPQNGDFANPLLQILTTKVLQYDRFRELNPHLKVKPALHQSNYKTREQVIKKLGYDLRKEVSEFNHTIQYWQEDMFIVIEVIETHNGNFSIGGSSFHAVVQTPTVLQACGYDDFFNGTYRIQCALFSACVNVRVNVTHLSFRQFCGVTKRQDITLLSKKICVTSNQVQMTPPEIWSKDNEDNWTWHTADMDYPIRNKTQFCAYVDAMTRDMFNMVGSSHMEFQHAYILNACLKYIKNLNKRLHYVQARFGTDVIGAMNKLEAEKANVKECLKSVKVSPFNQLASLNNTAEANNKKIPASYTQHKDCDGNGTTGIGMMIQAGSWDLVHRGLNYSLYNLMPKFDNTFRKFQTFWKANPSVKFLVMGPPTYHPLGYYAQSRNNDLVQLFNQAFQDVAEQNGITYISVFDMMYPRFEKVTPNDHYIQCQNGKCKGNVGIIAIQLAVKALIPGFD